MLTLGPLAFATPWMLAALASLPLLWWLLRVTPPAPQQVLFPAIRLLAGLRPKEEMPHAPPWWLLLLRMVVSALIIVALAGPLLPSGTEVKGSGPILLILDDGWDSARDFEKRRARLSAILEQAERERRAVVLLTTAAPAPGADDDLSLEAPGELKGQVGALTQKPWGLSFDVALERLQSLKLPADTSVVWLRSEVAHEGSEQFLARLQSFQYLSVIDALDGGPVWLNSPDLTGSALVAKLKRLSNEGQRPVSIRAIAEDGRVLHKAAGVFAEGEKTVEIALELPVELRNEVTRLEVEEANSAAGTFLMDERFRRRPVGLISTRAFEGAQPLLDELYYIDRALAPFSEIRRGSVESLLARDLAIAILPDTGKIPFETKQALENWIKGGGILLRFSGPRLAAASLEAKGLDQEDLVPVRLRQGDRTLGGALSWSSPSRFAPFPASSPFAGLTLPEDIEVRRQVMAEPAVDLGSKSWAILEDGTPIITAERREQGWLVLVHTSSNDLWSNLPLSGLFVELLRRVVDLSQGVSASREETLSPAFVLDGHGQLREAAPGVEPLVTSAAAPAPISPANPPGLYGEKSVLTAHNLGPNLADVSGHVPLPSGVERQSLSSEADFEFAGWLLVAAFALLIADMGIALLLRGALRFSRSGSAVASTLLLLVLLSANGQAISQNTKAETPPADPEAFALESALETRLAYVITGDAELDGISRDGLIGLTDTLIARTAIEPKAPYGVNVERDELSFFPLLYWPISRSQPLLSERAISRLNAYMRNGGIIVFDTRDRYQTSLPGLSTGNGMDRLARISQDLDIPPLSPVPVDHVLTRAFYLLDDFPGRYVGGQVWSANNATNSKAEVSPVIVGSNDWAAAWAIRPNGRPRFPVVPGGEVQREFAYRFGVNLVMYALTGNYKADQVHIPSILERLGQ